MGFRVLGPVGIVRAGSEVALGGARQRRLLTVLLLADGRWVSLDRIVDAVWSEETPPVGRARTVATYVSRLRSVLGESTISIRDDGYILERNGADLDATRFEQLVAQARTTVPRNAANLLDEALALWKGAAYGELGSEPWCIPAATRLEELRLVALELRAQARAELADDPQFIGRFETEARLVARLEHPHIVPLYDFWREPGGAYLVMRLLKGGSVEQRLAHRGALALAEVARIVDQIGEALAVAHASGVVHRDIKPANIVFDESDNAYLADFGIAVDAPLSSAPDVSSSAGSPLYAAPEQMRGDPASPASDVYAFAVLVWELLTGRAPFSASNLSGLVREKASGPLTGLPLLRSDVPAAVATVLAAATAPDARRRICDAGEFVLGFRDSIAGGAGRAAISTGGSTGERPRGSAARTLVSMRLEQGNPYRGLRAFAEEDASEFFGREQAVDRLLEAVRSSQFVAVVGPSGSGKSSLVRAGLVPRLRHEGSWVAQITPGRYPFDEIESALLQLAPAGVSTLMQQLTADDRGLVRAVRRVLPAESTTELVLIVDQFEELFTQCDPDTRRAALAALSHAATDSRSRMRTRAAQAGRRRRRRRPLPRRSGDVAGSGSVRAQTLGGERRRCRRPSPPSRRSAAASRSTSGPTTRGRIGGQLGSLELDRRVDRRRRDIQFVYTGSARRGDRHRAGRVRAHQGNSLAVSGDTLLVGNVAEQVIAYSYDPQDWVALACRNAGRNLTLEEWDRYLGQIADYAPTCDDWPPATE